MDRLLGRRYELNQGIVKYLVSYEGYVARISLFIRSPHESSLHRYDIGGCTWEPAENFANDSSKIDEFLDWWATENPSVDVHSLNPRDTIFVGEAYSYALKGMTWPGSEPALLGTSTL